MSSDTSFIARVIAHYTAGEHEGGPDRWAAQERVADPVVSLLGARPPARILDLACGTGLATTALALQGVTVTGIDCTPTSIAIAQQTSRKRGADVRWLCEDMRTLSCEREFDFVCLRDVVFSIFENAEEDLDLIRRIARALVDGGKCLFEVYDDAFARQHGVEETFVYDEGRERFCRPDAPADAICVRLYSSRQWEQMLAANGLRVVKTDGWSWRGDPPAPPWRANFIVAQKKVGTD